VDKRGNDGLTLTVFAIIAVILFAWYWHVNQSYPYYFMWDMDHITSLDTLLINSGMLPDHTAHTGFGMYLLLSKTIALGQAAGEVSVINLSEVANPVITTAELTGFIRAHQPFLILATVLLLTISLYLLFDISEWVAVLALAVIGTSEAFAYHASMIRTEMYSVFFWAGAVLVSIAAIRSSKTTRANLLYIAAGLLLGLSFTTKVQSLFYLAATGPFVLFLNSVYCKEPDIKSPRPTRSKWPLWAGLFSWIVFLILTACAYSQKIPAGVPTWAKGFGLTPLWLLFLILLFGLFIWQAVLTQGKFDYKWYKAVTALNYMAFGFILSFFLHFTVYRNASLGWQYLLLDYKMIFLRYTDMFSLKDLGTYAREFILYVNYNPVLFAVLCVLNAIVVALYLKKRIKRRELALTLLITVILLLNIPIGTRYILRDILWKEILADFWVLFLTAYILKHTSDRRLSKFVVVTMLVLLVSNISHSLVMPKRIDANYNLYGWQQEKLFRHVYGGNQKIFSRIIQADYNAKTLFEAKQQANDYKKIKRTAEFIFINQNITLRNIGIAWEGFRIFTTDPAWRLDSVPNLLRGAILVDNSNINSRKEFFLKEEYITQNFEYMDKFDKQDHSNNEIAILGRSDLAIFLFAPESDINNLVGHNIMKTSFKITAAKGNDKMEFIGAEIKDYASISVGKLSGRYFFILRKI
jgi:hypothetical protein